MSNQHLANKLKFYSGLRLSYKRNHSPDESIALKVFETLKQDHKLFIDQMKPVGTVWGECIEQELKHSDFLITFLSATSVNSEMVLEEIKKAHHFSKEQAGLPVILPVRLAFREEFQYPLSAYLNRINWAYWDNEDDTPRLIDELKTAISGGDLKIGSEQEKSEIIVNPSTSSLSPPFPSAQPIIEMPEGTMDSQSKFYKERDTDSIAIETIQRQGGVTLTIKAYWCLVK